MTLSELDRGELPDMALRLLEAKRVQDVLAPELTNAKHAHRNKLMDQYGTHGGLPGACFIRNDRIRAQKIIAQLETILDRDLRQIHETTLTLPELMRFVRQLALRDGTSVQYQELRRVTGISPQTQKKLLYALEATFIIRHLPLEGDFQGSAIFFEDHAEAMTLAQGQISEEMKWAGLVYRNLREQFFYRLGSNPEFFQFRTRAGVRVPFAVRTPESSLAFIPIRGEPSRSATAAAQSFLRRYSNSKAILVTDDDAVRVIDDRTLLISASRLLFA
jgi:predicted AAA+ superfamily ATPase